MEFKGYKLRFMKSAYLWEISEFKRYVPGNVWSFLSRVSLFENIGVNAKTAGLALLDEIQLIVISSALISLLSLPLILGENENSALLNQIRLIIVAAAAGIIIYSLTVAFIFRLRGKSNFLGNLFLPGYNFGQKLILLVIAAVDFFIFGLATLIACQSIFTFGPQLFIALSAFFTFALLAGYLSFITPMGLGVREGVITIGLTGLTTLPLASFLSIFSRISLIISEIIFLLIVFAFDTFSKSDK